MKTKALMRVVSVLLVLLFVMPTLALASGKGGADPSGPAATPFVDRQIVNRLEGSPFYLNRIYLSGTSLDAKLYNGASGEIVAFKEWFVDLGYGNTMIRMRSGGTYNQLAFGITVRAIKWLIASKVTVLRVINGWDNEHVPAPSVDYDMDVLLELAQAAELGEDQELYFTGLHDDIMLRDQKNGALTKLQDPLVPKE